MLITNNKNLTEKDWLEFIRQELYPEYTCNFNEEQKVGCGYDATFVSKDNKFTIELKNDLASEKYGNLYVEYAQTFNNKKTWQASGLSLAELQSDIYTHIAYKDDATFILFFHPKKLLSALFKSNFAIKETTFGRNGNKAGAFSKGYIVPFSEKSSKYKSAYGDKWKDFDDFYVQMGFTKFSELFGNIND